MKLDFIKTIYNNKKLILAISIAFLVSLVSVIYSFDNFPWKDILTGNILSAGGINYALLGKIFIALFGQTWLLSGIFYIVLNKYYKES